MGSGPPSVRFKELGGPRTRLRGEFDGPSFECKTVGEQVGVRRQPHGRALLAELLNSAPGSSILPLQLLMAVPFWVIVIVIPIAVNPMINSSHHKRAL